MRSAIMLAVSLACSGCVSMPKGPVCQVSVDQGGMNCADLASPEKPYFLPMARADKYVCRPEWYERQMIEWIKRELERE